MRRGGGIPLFVIGDHMIAFKKVSKVFETDSGTVHALDEINLSVRDGDIFGIIGMSGAGKSTLVRTINMLERPTSGTVEIDGVDVGTLSGEQLREIRRSVTMIFQGFNLLMQRNCLRNVCFPLELAGVKKAEARKRAEELLDLVGLKDKAGAYPSQLSGGQKQRVAIARALATNPKVLLCDEATSALDPRTTASILELIKDINRKLGITVIVITHQMSVVEHICNRVAILDGGKVVEQGDVAEIFSRPQTLAARRLVFPEESQEAFEAGLSRNSFFLRLVFNGPEAAFRPIVAELAIKKQIQGNIVFASIKRVGGRGTGSMILEFKNSGDMHNALEFINAIPDVAAQEVTDYVQ